MESHILYFYFPYRRFPEEQNFIPSINIRGGPLISDPSWLYAAWIERQDDSIPHIIRSWILEFIPVIPLEAIHRRLSFIPSGVN